MDYGLHAVVQDAGDGVLAEMSELARMGVSSAKVYITYDGRLDDGQILRVLDRAGGLGLLIAFHAENDAVIAFLRRRFRGQGHLSPAYHPLSRPDFCEAEAIYGVLALARAVGDVPIYIVHLSTASGLGRIEAARENGQTVYAEVCPQHLILEDSCYDLPALDGLKCIMSPPARKRADREALWRGLARGSIRRRGHRPLLV